jgi:hypothetical protein
MEIPMGVLILLIGIFLVVALAIGLRAMRRGASENVPAPEETPPRNPEPEPREPQPLVRSRGE